eukprot:scaffold8378_cov113-Isochrysis_galbana.AAC.5
MQWSSTVCMPSAAPNRELLLERKQEHAHQQAQEDVDAAPSEQKAQGQGGSPAGAGDERAGPEVQRRDLEGDGRDQDGHRVGCLDEGAGQDVVRNCVAELLQDRGQAELVVSGVGVECQPGKTGHMDRQEGNEPGGHQQANAQDQTDADRPLRQGGETVVDHTTLTGGSQAAEGQGAECVARGRRSGQSRRHRPRPRCGGG